MLQPSGPHLFPLGAYLPQAIGSDGALTSTGCCKQTECTHCGLVEKVGVPNASLGQYKIFHTGWLSTYCHGSSAVAQFLPFKNPNKLDCQE